MSADYLFGRYGVNDYYRGMLGYYGEFCSNGFDGIGSVTAGNDAIGRTLTRLHAPCSVVYRPKDTPLSVETPACIVAAANDPVATPIGAERVFTNSSSVRLNQGGHAGFASSERFVNVTNRVLENGQQGCR